MIWGSPNFRKHPNRDFQQKLGYETSGLVGHLVLRGWVCPKKMGNLFSNKGRQYKTQGHQDIFEIHLHVE